MFKRADIFFLISAIIAFAFANYLWFSGDIKSGFFVGLWVPSNLILVVYFKKLSTRSKKGD